MGKIRGLTSQEKKEGIRYIWSLKTESDINLLRSYIRFNLEAQTNQYYLVNDKIVIGDDATSGIREVDRDIFDFVGYGKHIGAEKENGNPDQRLLTFYKENPDKIPDFHKAIFETLTTPRRRSSK